MSRAEIIEKTVNALNKLPEIQGEEAADFADFMVKKNRLSIKMCKVLFFRKVYNFILPKKNRDRHSHQNEV